MNARQTLLPIAILSLYLGACTPLAYAQARPAQPGQPQGDKANEQEYGKDSNTEINVKNADIAAIVRIFSRKTKRNYILDEKVRGKVSIYLPGKVSSDEALRILDSVLALKGFTSVPIGENLWKIVPSKEARQSTIPTLTESRTDTPSSAVVTRLLSLKYVNAQDIQQILAQLVSADGLVNAYTGTNSLIVIDSEDNIERLVNIVDELDVPFSNREMTIIPVKHADVEDIAQKLADIMGDGAKKASSGADQVRASIGDPAQTNAGALPIRAGGKTVSARGLEPKIIPDQRTNAIIVVADDDTTARIRALISQLDSKIDLSGNKFYVYRCQHANAEELAQVLSGLVGGGSGASPLAGSSSKSSGTGLGGSGTSGNTSSPGNQGGFPGSSTSKSKRSAGGSGGSGAPVTAQLGENISITADPATNSLIVAASKPDYEKIRGLLSQIDVKRRQALVEATLLEVSIDNFMRASAGFLASGGGADGGVLARSDFAPASGSLNTLFSNPQNLQGFTLAAASAGSLTLPGGITIPTQSLLISAAQNSSNVNVLSAPTILATDNEEAQIVVGQNVPFLASTSTNQTTLNNTFNQVDRQDVGITLRITPQISSRDYVTLNVFTEVSAVVPSTINSALGPTTTKRQSETTIIAKDGQMIVTGGLISDDVSESDDGVPYFKDIPIIGHAFKANSQARLQKNLLIFLTPRIIKDQYDARDATLESRDHMEDVIATYDVAPRRLNVLKNDRIDQVAETLPYEGPKPGTVLAPARAQKTAKSNPERVQSAPTIVLDGSRGGTLNLELPNSKQEDSVLDLNAVGTSNEPLASIKSSAVQAAIQPQVAGTYVTIELTRKEDFIKELPFLNGTLSRVAGIMLPAESSQAAATFFKPGQSYLYLWDGERIPVTVKKVFSSLPSYRAGAAAIPKSWHTLSPYETMNLGKGPWLQGATR